MFGVAVAEDDDFVNIEKSGLPSILRKQYVQCSLKCVRGVVYSKGHSLLGKSSRMTNKNSFVFVFDVDWDLPESAAALECGKDGCVTE